MRTPVSFFNKKEFIIACWSINATIKVSLQLWMQATLRRRGQYTMTVVVKTGGWRFLMKSSTKMNKRKTVPRKGRANGESTDSAEGTMTPKKERPRANWESCAEIERKKKKELSRDRRPYNRFWEFSRSER